MKAVYCLGNFNANISLTFQGVKNLSAHRTYVRFGLFCKRLSISQRISKIE